MIHRCERPGSVIDDTLTIVQGGTGGSDPGHGLYIFGVCIDATWTGGGADVTLSSNWQRWLIATEWLREHPYDPDAPELRSWHDHAPRCDRACGRRCFGWAVSVLR